MTTLTVQRLSIFPLGGALLFPRAQLPLHIFEPRYRAMVSESLVRDRLIAMIQPRDTAPLPALFEVGCIGRIADVEAMPDGRYNIILEGTARFRVRSELSVTTAFRQVEGEIGGFDDSALQTLPHVLRADFEREARRFADVRGIRVDWEGVARLDDEMLINGAAQASPFDVASKQALLEAPTLVERADLLVQLLRFFRDPSEGGDGVTLQ